jgi:transglutaminase-like putative cysteine protease
MKYFFLIIFSSLFLSNNNTFSQEIKYKISDIPQELLKNSKAVIRQNDLCFEILSISKAKLKVTYAISIMNKSGIHDSYFINFYNKFLKISNINAIIYDENGKKIRKIRKDKMLDYSAISGFSLYEDTRVKFIDPNIRKTPFTIEYTYTINFNGLLNYPDWYIYTDYNIAVESSVFRIIAPKDIKIRYLNRNINIEPVITHKTDNDEYLWSIKNLKSLREEPFSLALKEYVPMVLFAPSDFEIGGYEGNCDSWEIFGKWIKLLNEDKDKLPPETENKIRNIVKPAQNDYEKIQILYDYLQNKTRYVSIQVGIGGWQPFDAETVDRLSYGDCKALTNYMKSMLKVIGIDSYYSLVMAGKDATKLIEEFPSSQFNHAFLCIPQNNDTIWLECTSQRTPFGFIGSFTGDREVLLINEDGGKIVKTKTYNLEDNHQSRKAMVSLDKLGNGTADVTTFYKGLLYENVVKILRSDETDKKKILNNSIQIPEFKIESFNHDEVKEIIPYVEQNLKLTINNYGSKFGDRLLINLNLMNKIEQTPKTIKDRKSEILIRNSYMETDTIIYKIPDNYFIEDIPENLTINSEFGSYAMNVENGGETIKYVRNFQLNKGIYSKENFDELKDFYKEIISADKSKIVLKMKE